MSTWDAGLFWQKYYEFWNKVVELHYVDAMLDWIDEGSFAGRPYYVEFTVGKTYPFEKRRVFQNPGQGATGEENRDNIHKIVEEMPKSFVEAAEAFGDTLFSGVDTSAEFITRPDPGSLQYAVESIKGNALTIESRGNDGDIGNLRVYLNDWEGDSYDSFMVFHQRLTDAGKYQSQYMNAVANYLDAAGGVVTSGQLALIDGITQLADAADDQLKKREADNRSESSTVKYLGILGTIAGGAGLIPGPQQAVLGAVSFGFGVLSTYIPEQAQKEVDVKVASAEQLGTQFTELFNDTVSGCNAYLELIQSEGTSRLRDDVSDFWDTMVPPRPDIIDKVDPKEFHHDTSPYWEG